MQFTTLLSLLLLFFFTTTTTTLTHAHNITRLLAKHPDFSTFNHYLANLANDGEEVTLQTKVNTAKITGTLPDEQAVTIYSLDKVLLPKELFKAAPAPEVAADAPKADKNAGVRFGGGRIAALGLSLWLAFTLLTLGNDLTPANHVPELIFSIFIVFSRVILFPLLFVIIQVVLQAVMGKTKEMQLRCDMEGWMSRRQLPPD